MKNLRGRAKNTADSILHKLSVVKKHLNGMEGEQYGNDRDWEHLRECV